MKYEIFYLIAASKEPELDKIKSDVYDMITSNEGTLLEKETQEKRKLAYQVKHETHGTYIARRFELNESEKLNDIINKLNLHTGVLRFIITNAAELPELKSKEERIGTVAAKENIAPKKEDLKPREFKRETKEEIKTEEKKEKVEEIPAASEEEKAEKKKNEQEDIDKKLEEILNI